jgi:hypothetical protein
LKKLIKTLIAALLLALAIGCQQQRQVSPTQQRLDETNQTILANAKKSEDAEKEKESKSVGVWQTQEQTDTYDGRKSIQIWQPLYISGAGSARGFDFVVGFERGKVQGAWINVTCIIEGSSPNYSHERTVRYKFDDGKSGVKAWTISDKRKQMQLLSQAFVVELLKHTRLTMEIGCDQDDKNDTVVVLAGLRNAMDAAGVKVEIAGGLPKPIQSTSLPSDPDYCEAGMLPNHGGCFADPSLPLEEQARLNGKYRAWQDCLARAPVNDGSQHGEALAGLLRIACRAPLIDGRISVHYDTGLIAKVLPSELSDAVDQGAAVIGLCSESEVVPCWQDGKIAFKNTGKSDH